MQTAEGSKERWQRVDHVLDLVLDTPPGKRQRVAAEACAGDPELRREVESLLLAGEAAGRFLESPLRLEPDPGPDPGDPTLLAPGRCLAGRYRTERYLGGGGMGAVYRAWDLLLQVEVALKVLDPELLTSPSRIDLFRREVRLARRVTHGNVCRIHDLVVDDGLAFITMEYIEGESLAERLRRATKISVPWCLDVLRDIARGLGAAHAAGVVHRDLKPANVLLREGSDRAVVADFGIAAEAATDGTVEAETVGTRGYMSPEQAAGAPLTARSDFYSLGVLAYQMLTTRLPGEGARDDGELPRELADFVSACLRCDPRDRPADAAALLRLLGRPSAQRWRRRPSCRA